MKRTLYYACPAVALVLMTIAIATAQSPKEEAEAAAEAAVAEAEAAAAAQVEAAKSQARAAVDQARAARRAAEAEHARAADVAVEVVAPIKKQIRVLERHPAWTAADVTWERKAPDEETMKLVDLDHKLSGKVAEIVSKFKNISEDEDRAEAEKALAEAIAEQFAVRQQLREKQLEQLEDQIKRLRGLQDQRSEQKDRIITDRVQQLIREASGLGWGETSDNFNFNFDFKVREELPFGALPRIAAPARVMALDAGGGPHVIITPDGDHLIRTDEQSDDPSADKPSADATPKR